LTLSLLTSCMAFLFIFLIFPLLAEVGVATTEVDSRRPYLTLSKADYDNFAEIPILSPVPFTGSWVGGHTMRIGAELAMDIINSAQTILPNFRLNTSWFDDRCNADYGPQIMLEKWNEKDYAALGANGCSGVCRSTALLSPSIHIPHISYGCAAGFLSDETTFPDFSRMMTDESAMADVFQVLGRKFNWTKMVIISGTPSRWDGPATSLEAFFKEDEIEAEWLVPRNPGWEDLKLLMEDVKRSFQRVVVVLGYEPFYRKVICAGMLAGIPKGMVWLSVGWHKVGWWAEEDAELLELEPTCTPELITEYFNGGIGPSGSGMPTDANMDNPLDCLPGYTSRSFRALFESHAMSLGYPLGENLLPGSPYAEIVGYGADGICTFAYMFREMLITRGYSLSDVIHPTEAVYIEMRDIIKNEIDFWGVSGRVFWEGNNKPGVLSVNQVQDGELRTVASVDLDGVMTDVAGESLIWGDGETAPSSSFMPCPAGTLRSSDGSCSPCPTGTYYYEVLGECIECEVGQFNPYEGMVGEVSCISCSDGTVATEKGSSACTACEAGTISNGKEGNGAFCVDCPIGYHQPLSGAAECSRCAVGSYQSEAAQSYCASCPGSRTTRFFAATSVKDCVCTEGTYESWPIPSSDPYECLSCPEGMTCPEGGRLADWFGYSNNTGDKAYPLLQEQYYSHAYDPVFVFKCLDERDCPGGDPGSCAPKREGIACGRCERKYYYFGGKCNACSEVELTTVLFPILPALGGPLFALLVYTRLMEPLNIRFMDGPKNRALALCFFFLMHFQTLGLINQFNLVLPNLVKIPWEGFAMVNSGIQFLRPECAGGGSLSDFSSMFIMRTSMPLFLAAMFIGNYFIFKILIIWTRHLKLGDDSVFTVGMRVDYTINAFGTLMYTFSIAVLAIAFDLFKCFPHPNGLDSLRVSPDVMCYSDEWNAMIIVGVLAIMVYFVATFALFQWVCHVAPMKYGDPYFRRKWKFLLIKWKPNRWWFGQVFLLKGVFLNLTLVLFKSGALQVLWTAFSLMCYIVFVMVLRPWRHQAANLMDCVVNLSLLSIGLVTIYYADRNEEAENTLDKVLATLTFLPIVIVGMGVLNLIWIWQKSPNTEVVEGLEKALEIEELLVRVSHQGVLSLFHSLMNTTSSERNQILCSLKLVLAESTAVQVPGARRLIQRTAKIADELEDAGKLEVSAAHHHTMLLLHFQRRAQSYASIPEESQFIFGEAAALTYENFESRFLKAMQGGSKGGRPPSFSLTAGADLPALARYAAKTMDPYGEGIVRKVHFEVFAQAMTRSFASLATMSFEVEA